MPRDLLPEPVVRVDRPMGDGCLATSPLGPDRRRRRPAQILVYNTDSLDLPGSCLHRRHASCGKFSKNGRILLIGGGVDARAGRSRSGGRHHRPEAHRSRRGMSTPSSARTSPRPGFVALGGPRQGLQDSTRPTTARSSTTAKKPHRLGDRRRVQRGRARRRQRGPRRRECGSEAKNAAEFYNSAGHKARMVTSFRLSPPLTDSNFLASAQRRRDLQALGHAKRQWKFKTVQAHPGGVLSIASHP